MKNINYIIITALVAFDLLIYKQQPGINVLIFNIVLIGLCINWKPELKLNKKWYLSVISVIVSSTCVAWYGDGLSFFATILSLTIMAAVINEKDNSLLTSIFSTGITYIISPVSIIKRMIYSGSGQTDEKSSMLKTKIILIITSIAITSIFFLIYQNSNMIFYHFTKKIDLSFITWGWFFFTLNGLLLVFSFFNYKEIKWLNRLLDKPSKKITEKSNLAGIVTNKLLTPTMENFMGKLLLTLLNLLLVILNALDFNYLVKGKLPEGITYSQYVHQGVGMLILSIILAISILLFLFRGNINFLKNNSVLKTLSYIWAIQNIFMVASTILRNNMYIEAYGLTEKRIGVYFYLFLSIIGLITTILKIYRKYSNSFLIRMNSAIFFIILIISCTVNWDMIITRHNLSRNDADKNLNYLSGLTNSNIPLLIDYMKINDPSGDLKNSTSNKIDLYNSIYSFMSNKKRYSSWRSWNYTDYKTLNAIKKNEIKRFYISYISLKDISSLSILPHLEEIYIRGCWDWNIQEWAHLQNIRKLHLDSNYVNNISFIGKLKNLEYLEINNTMISDYSPLYSLKNLKILVITKPVNKKLDQLRAMLPNTKIVTI